MILISFCPFNEALDTLFLLQRENDEYQAKLKLCFAKRIIFKQQSLVLEIVLLTPFKTLFETS